MTDLEAKLAAAMDRELFGITTHDMAWPQGATHNAGTIMTATVEEGGTFTADTMREMWRAVRRLSPKPPAVTYHLSPDAMMELRLHTKPIDMPVPGLADTFHGLPIVVNPRLPAGAIYMVPDPVPQYIRFRELQNPETWEMSLDTHRAVAEHMARARGANWRRVKREGWKAYDRARRDQLDAQRRRRVG